MGNLVDIFQNNFLHNVTCESSLIMCNQLTYFKMLNLVTDRHKLYSEINLFFPVPNIVFASLAAVGALVLIIFFK